MEHYGVCDYCGQRIDFARAAVTLGRKPHYQPFMEDWRGGYVALAHPRCFAEAEGVDSLLAAVEREDLRREGRL